MHGQKNIKFCQDVFRSLLPVFVRHTGSFSYSAIRLHVSVVQARCIRVTLGINTKINTVVNAFW